MSYITVQEQQAGVWVARYSDRSGIVAFPTELEALRHAVSAVGMEVAFVKWGDDLFRGEP